METIADEMVLGTKGEIKVLQAATATQTVAVDEH